MVVNCNELAAYDLTRTKMKNKDCSCEIACYELQYIGTYNYISVMTMLSKTEAMRLRYNALVVVSNCNSWQQHKGPERLGA